MTDPVIDLSHWNEAEKNATVKDIAAAKAAGLVGIIHKCTEGTSYLDPEYADRRQLAEANGLLFGAYHFLRPGDMQRQADWFMQNVGTNVGLLLAADHEDAGVSLSDLKEFLRIVTDLSGRMPAIYSGFLIKEQVGDAYDAELAIYRLWLAHYTSGEPSWPDHTWLTWWLWQYTDKGAVSGIEGPVDCNRFVADLESLREQWDGSNGGDGGDMNVIDDAREEALRDVLEKARLLVQAHKEFMENHIELDRWGAAFNELRLALETFDEIEAVVI